MGTKYFHMYFTAVNSSKVKPDYNCYEKKNKKLVGILSYIETEDEYHYFPKANTHYSLYFLSNLEEFIYNLNYE